MSDKRTEDGFHHSPDPVPGVDALVRQDGESGDVTVSFGDGSEDLKVDRREFMRISGVAAATAAMAGAACRNPVEKIVPYVDRPEKIRIGMPNYYASVCHGCASQCGVLVQTRVGRPIKLEGNPQHPVGRGGLCARGQSSYMDLYDPSRAKAPQKIGSGATTWDELDKAVSAAIKSAGSIRVLTGTVSSPSLLQLIRTAGNGMGGKLTHHQFDAINEDAAHQVSAAAYGKAHIPHYRFDKADIIVSLGADPLGTWLSPVEFTKQFTSRRDPDGDMNRLVSFEPTLSVTGMNADDRYAVRAADLSAIAMALAHVVVVEKKAGPLANDGAASGALAAFTPAAVAESTGVAADTLTALGSELAKHVGTSLAVSGGTTDSIELHAAVTLLNEALGSDGTTIDRMRASKQAMGRTSELQALIKDMNDGKVDVLIVDGTNPVYAAPSLDFAEAMSKVKTVISTADRVDETAAKATYLAPTNHALESWGDAEQHAGVFSLQQPTLQPLADTRSFPNSLIAWFAPHVAELQAFQTAPELPAANRPGANYPTDSGPYYRFLRNHWKTTVFAQSQSLASFDRFWSDTLSTGSYRHPNGRRISRGVQLGALTGLLPKALPKKAAGGAGDLSSKELQLVATVQMYDGRQANNGHLQELPDPITKHAWGSYITLGPKTFKEAGFEAQGEWVEVTVGDTTHRFQAILQPGQHEGVIAVPLGYGRTAAGDIGSDVGENAFDYASFDNGVQKFGGIAAAAKRTGEGEPIAIVQGAQVLDTHRRPIQSFTTLPEYKEDQAAGVYSHPQGPDMWGSHDYSELKWGMAVDLTKCTGCSACVTACVEENNIPVVGRRGIIEGREMHWMRIDRYYHLPPEAAKLQKSVTADPMFAQEPVVAFGDYMGNPRVTAQPMMCQHCEHAPCETVCPVSATMHSADGLNQMAYNRCVGTRYCSNNCPFKVRRFNWFNYVTDRSDTVIARLYNMVEDGLLAEHGRMNATEPMQQGRNPDVTVRARGVMEKCTFCVQRIRRAGVQMRKEGRTKVRDGDVITACQQSCPADAIVFGNLSDENSAVAKLHAKQRALSPLQEVGVHSSVAYLTSVFHSNSKAYVETSKHGDDAAHEGNAADHG